MPHSAPWFTRGIIGALQVWRAFAGPSLGGVARTLSVAQLRLRVVDNARVNAQTVMPSYYRVEGLDRVAGAYRGKPILDPEQVEDIVAYLSTLK